MQFNKKDVKIFLLSGKAKSGKDEGANIISDYYKDKKCIKLSYAYYLKDYIKRITGWDGNEDDKPRELLQQMGIDLIKNKIDDRLLINRLLEDIEVFSYFYDIIIITDARLKEEIEIPKEKLDNLVTIRINRENIISNLTDEQKHHLTEVALDNYDNFDYIIDNNSDYAHLKEEVTKILKEENYE